MSQSSSLVRPRAVTGDGEGLVSHAGLEWLAETADLSGLTAGFSTAMAGVELRRHDPGRTLVQMVLALAGGATCPADIAVLRNQPSMFGPVGSDPTVWRTFNRVTPAEFRRLDIAPVNLTWPGVGRWRGPGRPRVDH
ncbi:MAG: hypothetical protein GY929_01855 [Actinomycetia bacterium]|nr:hypothetical protein [Actinomycetes bacterium]